MRQIEGGRRWNKAASYESTLPYNVCSILSHWWSSLIAFATVFSLDHFPFVIDNKGKLREGP